MTQHQYLSIVIALFLGLCRSCVCRLYSYASRRLPISRFDGRLVLVATVIMVPTEFCCRKPSERLAGILRSALLPSGRTTSSVGAGQKTLEHAVENP
ncbi:uncharacterized protein PHACADRAFT_262648 [Phanerochaete carnosa HHB-10118-sp]|uniref:Secreted protein n=1 Tax=Phanerochaete carnosa (strain HHB-10118-sp) TaxID=650164 RepID=K5VZT7_PHACS|nr:uncharacterized protein PHACADRAFT_262648 [Phanerochaete carnosa HHB-10118-sp]EKM52139.1 hypothetical protein PHACADRAFT_262648 [Phanerochaete carnosa HHB-10118-sp]